MTTPRDAIAGLIERLRSYEGRNFETTACYNGLRDEAAAQLAAQAAEIDEFANEVARYKAYAEKFEQENAALSARVKELDEEATDWRGLYFDARSECVNMKGHYKNVCAAAATAEARATRLQQELDTSNDNHRAMAKQLARIGQERDEALAALKPFVDVAEEMLSRGWDASNVALALDNPSDPHRVTAGDFFAIRQLAVSNEKEGK